MKKITPLMIATALVQANPQAGRPTNLQPATKAEQIQNLLRDGPYGPYVVAGDPGGWCPGAVASIYMEQKGTADDCVMPLDYWGGGFEVSARASALLPDGAFIEFVNAAIAVVIK